MASSSSSSRPSHSTPSSSSWSWNHDVFLSFRGDDTRKTFVDHLYSALDQQGIYTYKDDITLPRGESIGPSLEKAIEESQIAIIVFSKNYADSAWCLDELAYIMKYRDERGLTVMPIFYNVDPSDVRKQNGEFGKAFAKQELENSNKVESWRKALECAATLSGWVPKHISDGHESECIKEIVSTISRTLLRVMSNANSNLIGIATRVEDLKSQLEIGSCDVRMVGIWGMGGGGKTTLASSLYKEISCNFDGCCFVENIREESSKYDLKKLQAQILSDVLTGQSVDVRSVEEGKSLIKRRLCRKSVLVILDDVDSHDQLEALAGSHDWFGEGSRIIITTRDVHLLEAHRVTMIHDVSLLTNDEAIQLFSRHAFGACSPVEGYEELSVNVVSKAGGLPLALKIFGCFLCRKNMSEWMSALDRLNDIPDSRIIDKLKISYDGLQPDEKELFLDIACFFRHKYYHSKYEAMEMLDACGFHPVIGVKVLIQKALITIDRYGRFDMHDLVQEMAHHIVRGEHPNSPEKHSRVWRYEDVLNMCIGDATRENDKIEALQYCFPAADPPRLLEVVANMKKLRFLSVDNYEKRGRRLVKVPKFLPNELRYISWRYYPASSLPTNFQPTKLSVLRLQDSLVKQLWKGRKVPKSL